MSASLCVGVLAAAMLAALGCGEAGVKESSSPGAPTEKVSAQALQAARREQDGDRDNDTLGLGPLDNDHDAIPTYGPPATQSERRPILALFERYFAAAATGDVSTVCSLLYPVAIERLMEEHSHGVGPASLKGRSCRQIAAKILSQEHSELVAKRASLKVPLVELHAKRAWVVLDFGRGQQNLVLLHHEGGTWWLTALHEEAL